MTTACPKLELVRISLAREVDVMIQIRFCEQLRHFATDISSSTRYKNIHQFISLSETLGQSRSRTQHNHIATREHKKHKKVQCLFLQVGDHSFGNQSLSSERVSWSLMASFNAAE